MLQGILLMLPLFIALFIVIVKESGRRIATIVLSIFAGLILWPLIVLGLIK